MTMLIHLQNYLLTLCVILILAPRLTPAQHYVQEAALRDEVLTEDYNYKIRPDTTVEVGVRLSLLAINQLDVPMQLLSVSGWLTVTWNDTRLTWNSTAFGDIHDIYDTEEAFWRPQLIVDNAVNNLGILEDEKLLIRATATGVMTWEPPGIFETYCDVDVTYYPFDTQLCKVEVTSWAYTLNEVNLQATDWVDRVSDVTQKVYLADYEENGEWDIMETHTERRVLTDGADTHSQIDFHIKLRRKPAYYANTILIPVIVTSLLCVLVFWLPADSGEKVGYSLTILLTYTVMLTLVSDLMPPTSKTTSVLSVYLTIILFMGVISCLMTVCVLVCHHHNDEEPIPRWLFNLNHNYLIKIAGWKPSKFHMDNNSHSFNSSTSFSNGAGNNSRGHGGHPGINMVSPGDVQGKDSIGMTTRDGDTEVKLMGTSGSDSLLELKWAEVAAILDKVCFKALGVFVVLLTTVVMLVLVVGAYSQ